MLSNYVYFLIYICVDFCYHFNEIPYKDIPKHEEGEEKLHNIASKICGFCSLTWNHSPIGNASEYTRFLLFTRETGSNFTVIIPGDINSFTNSTFDKNKNTKVLIHGWHDDGLIHFPVETARAYLSAQDVNVIVVDWGKVSHDSYPIARIAVDPVGRYVASLLGWLVSQLEVPEVSIHIIGHSLGAQIAGVAGEHVTFGQIHRISGLDPAGPGFTSGTNGRLDQTDAQFVDIIHTAGWWAGYYDPCGHVDFYPNGGTPIQPGCNIDLGKCSHLRSYKFFIESITSDEFVARACTSWSDYKAGRCEKQLTAIMGENVDQSSRGNFYLHTAGSYPYALGNSTEMKHNFVSSIKSTVYRLIFFFIPLNFCKCNLFYACFFFLLVPDSKEMFSDRY